MRWGAVRVLRRTLRPDSRRRHVHSHSVGATSVATSVAIFAASPRGVGTDVTWSRRRWLAAPAAGWVAARAGVDRAVAGLDPAVAGPDDESFWLQVRNHFDGDPSTLSFNHAGLSPAPRAVRTAMAREFARADVEPSRVLWRQQEQELDGVRKRLAAVLGCDAGQVALTPNATWGLHTVILGLPLQSGDEIVVSAHEYSRTFEALQQRQRRDGVRTVEVPLATPAAEPGAVVADVLARCGPRTRLVVLSQATYLTGQLLPVAAIAAALRPLGVPLLVDGAHGIGLLPATFAGLGGAFYTACLHKWLMGPVGTGVFVCEPAWIDRLWPLCGAGDERRNSMRKFESYGTHAFAPLLAVGAALDFHDWLGRERKAARLEWLRQRLLGALADVPGLAVHSSADPTRACAIVAISLAGCAARPLASWLWREHRVHATSIDAGGLAAVRLSPNVFTTAAEIERLAQALRRAARDGI